MSSYKGHSLFALILSLLFFHNPLTIALVLISANIPDFDHDFKKENVYGIIILGLIIFIVLYILKLPYFIGLILIYFGLSFYFSKHRSFTHSIFALIIFTILLTFLIFSSYNLFPNDYSYVFIIILLSLLFLNKNLVPFFLLAFIIAIFIFGIISLTYLEVSFAIFLGIFSHIVLDSFTPSGVKLFAPLSSKTFFKKFGIVSIILLLIFAIYLNVDKWLTLITTCL